MILFHGSTDFFNIFDKRIIPPNDTIRLREWFRKKDRNVVFLTRSKASAEMYAKKASEYFGGYPIVYIVDPQGTIIDLGTEVICDYAEILEYYRCATSTP